MYIIPQSKPAGVEEIDELLRRLGLAYTKDVRHRAPGRVGSTAIKTALPSTAFRLTAAASRSVANVIADKRSLPRWCAQMTGAQFDVFLAAYIRADGSLYGGSRREGTAVVYGSERVLGEIQGLCVSHGVSASVRQDTRGTYRLNVCRRTTTDVRAFANVEHYSGKVWCLRVPLRNFMVRHNGIAHFTGNSWNEGEEIIRQMVTKAKVHIPVHEWAAKLELVFPNKAVCRISAAHNFKGHSQYSSLHGLRKEAIWYQDGAHVIVAGHIHFGEIAQCELPGGHCPWLIRVRGYKEMDSHALVNGFHEGKHFSSVMTIIDPDADDRHRVSVFTDLELGARVLAVMRADAAKKLKAAQRKSNPKRKDSSRRKRKAA